MYANFVLVGYKKIGQLKAFLKGIPIMKRHACLLAVAIFAFTMVAEAAFDARPVWVGFGSRREGHIDVAGLRLNLPYSYNDAVTGVDLGLLGSSTYMWGLQVNLLSNIVRDRAGVLQVGLYNDVGGMMTGMQAGLWCNTRCGEGGQGGLLNTRDEFYGVQLGLVNRANYLYGFQIGAINVIRGSKVPFMPFLNIGF